MSKTADVVIIGAGAAGLMCAATASYQGKSVLLLDHSDKPAKKVLMSGGGRCNFTNLNTTPANFLSTNPHFCISALKRYTPQHFLELVERHGIDYVEKAPGQLFCTNSSKDIQQLLLTEAEWSGVNLHMKTSINSVTTTADSVKITSSMGNISAGALVVATGGLSIPTLGATGWGYDLARQFGLEVLSTRAGLVPFTLHPELKTQLAPLSGLSCEVSVSCHGQTFTEPLLITHRGLSGPALLQISSYWQAGDELSINWLPYCNLLKELQQLRQQHPRAHLSSWLGEQLPKRLVTVLISLLKEKGIHLPERNADASNQQLDAIANALQNWTFKPAGTEGYRTAEVTLGGINTQQISSQTLAVNGLEQIRFIGEVLDVTGQLGGYNFQWAWASAVACANNL
ncbi:MAG TPA: NAD(P)/FAD-dependent oxidoreductase [Marinospirillum sp.]|uniref:NAD(P)/FAD-dependent oxidoreductase n=1 Tax=Marinospirillum sp. TaxID=2183934 RepID=UPI002B4A11A9|nr:NAD(P)/FAD-dependent oxidoreductase [Marinospirillum sp.]HKM15610.1 NAD(P)/FAD-dependent oxidoreductase [Marinospirillum sp.]